MCLSGIPHMGGEQDEGANPGKIGDADRGRGEIRCKNRVLGRVAVMSSALVVVAAQTAAGHGPDCAYNYAWQ